MFPLFCFCNFPMTGKRPQPITLYLLTGVSLAIGVNLVSWRQTESLTLGPAVPAVVIFSVFFALLEWRPLPALSESRLMVFSWTFAYTLSFLVSLPVVLIVIAISVASTQIPRGASLLKAAFNISHLQIGVALGWWISSLMTEPLSVANGGEANLVWIIGTLVACAVGLVVSSAMVGVAIGIKKGIRLTDSIWRMFVSNVETDLPLLILTPVFVIVGVHGPLMLPLLMISSFIVINSGTRALRNEQEAIHDELTGLPNRRALGQMGSLALDAAVSRSGDLAVVQIDLDGFKDVNDRLGHKFGDEVLRIISARLAQSKRSTDHLFRMGGDEFAFVLGGCNVEDARRFAHGCLSEIETPMEIEGVRLAISGSLGVSNYPAAGESLTDLLHSADLAMYLAKRTRSGVEVFSDGVAKAVTNDDMLPAHNDFRSIDSQTDEPATNS